MHVHVWRGVELAVTCLLMCAHVHTSERVYVRMEYRGRYGTGVELNTYVYIVLSWRLLCTCDRCICDDASVITHVVQYQLGMRNRIEVGFW